MKHEQAANAVRNLRHEKWTLVDDFIHKALQIAETVSNETR